MIQNHMEVLQKDIQVIECKRIAKSCEDYHIFYIFLIFILVEDEAKVHFFFSFILFFSPISDFYSDLVAKLSPRGT